MVRFFNPCPEEGEHDLHFFAGCRFNCFSGVRFHDRQVQIIAFRKHDISESP